jgi:hypothetical protein
MLEEVGSMRSVECLWRNRPDIMDDSCLEIARDMDGRDSDSTFLTGLLEDT